MPSWCGGFLLILSPTWVGAAAPHPHQPAAGWVSHCPWGDLERGEEEFLGCKGDTLLPFLIKLWLHPVAVPSGCPLGAPSGCPGRTSHPKQSGAAAGPARSSAPGDLRAMWGAGRDPSGSTIPARGLGFTQEGQGDAGRKWSNPSPSAGGDLVTKPNGARRPRKDRARGDRLSRCWAGQGTRQQHPLGMVPYPHGSTEPGRRAPVPLAENSAPAAPREV